MRNLRCLGIDYGTVRIGVAVSDPLGITATGIETIQVKGKSSDAVLQRLVDLAKQYEVTTVVVGLPKRTDNRPSESEGGARALHNSLTELLEIPVVLHDERFTSVMANRILQESTVKKNKRRDVVDQVAAEVILKDYIEMLRMRGET